MFEFSNLTEEETRLIYLKSGLQTKLSPLIMGIVKNYRAESFTKKVAFALNFVHSIHYNSENRDKMFRKRTASEIISDNYVTGCTDANIVFIALARALHIPAKYVETIDEDAFIKRPNEFGAYNGHVYTEVFNDTSGWQIIDVVQNKIGVLPSKDNRIIILEGLDSWDIGIKNFRSLKIVFDGIRVKNNLNY